jgi:hypothetical protein
MDVEMCMVSASPEYGDAGIVARYLSGRDTAVGYHFYFNRDGMLAAQVYEKKNVSRFLARVPFPFRVGTWYRIQLAAEGPSMTLSVDGNPMCCVNDAFCLKGGIGFRVAKSEVQFRNLAVTGFEA